MGFLLIQFMKQTFLCLLIEMNSFAEYVFTNYPDSFTVKMENYWKRSMHVIRVHIELIRARRQSMPSQRLLPLTGCKPVDVILVRDMHRLADICRHFRHARRRCREDALQWQPRLTELKIFGTLVFLTFS